MPNKKNTQSVLQLTELRKPSGDDVMTYIDLYNFKT